MDRKQFSKGEQEEIKDLFDGTWASIREISGIFRTSVERLRWFLDYKGYKCKHTKVVHNWQKNHPEKVRIMQARASKEYQSKPGVKEKMRLSNKKWCLANREQICKRRREWYLKNKNKKK